MKKRGEIIGGTADNPCFGVVLEIVNRIPDSAPCRKWRGRPGYLVYWFVVPPTESRIVNPEDIVVYANDKSQLKGTLGWWRQDYDEVVQEPALSTDAKSLEERIKNLERKVRKMNINTKN